MLYTYHVNLCNVIDSTQIQLAKLSNRIESNSSIYQHNIYLHIRDDHMLYVINLKIYHILNILYIYYISLTYLIICFMFST